MKSTSIQIHAETAVIVWDAEQGIEHFIRKATFDTEASHFGFLVPTPTKPELTEVKEKLFDHLAKMDFELQASLSAAMLARQQSSASNSTVTVVEAKQVAGLEASIILASDPESLNRWLEEHEYESGAELVEWLKRYLDRGWFITAFKIAKENPTNRQIGSNAVRMSFRTDRPFYPYREPSLKKSKPLVTLDSFNQQSAEGKRIILGLLTRFNELQNQMIEQESLLQRQQESEEVRALARTEAVKRARKHAQELAERTAKERTEQVVVAPDDQSSKSHSESQPSRSTSSDLKQDEYDVAPRKTVDSIDTIPALLTRIDEQSRRIEQLTSRQTRSLKIFFIGTRKFDARLENNKAWNGKAIRLSHLSPEFAQELSKLTEIESLNRDREFWLTLYHDQSVVRADEEIVFSADPNWKLSE